jgi:regulation of enolase protein 1 (concanavalin A-like superfamily)
MTQKLVFVALVFLMIFSAGQAVQGSLIAYYPLDGNANDMSGFGTPANGTLVGSPTFEGGAPGFGQSIRLNGTSQYINCGNPGGKFDLTTQVSVACWTKIVSWSSSGSDTLIAKGPQGQAFRLYRFGTGNPMIFALGTTTPEYYAYVSTGKNIADSAWHHVAGTWDGTTISLYIDGALDDSSPGTGTLTTNTLDVWIGNNPGATTRFWNGWIDDVYIFNNGLSATEVGQVMQGALANPYKSRNADPANAATDVVRDKVLSWTAGKDAVSHNVYFGTSADNLKAVATAQTGTTYDPPGLLDYGKTYYWRVDEVNSTNASSPAKGDVWSFTAEPYSYRIAAKITATASQAKSTSEDPCNTVNDAKGLTGDLQSVDEKTMWVTPKSKDGGKLPAWIRYDFDKVYKLDQMWVWNYNSASEGDIGVGAKSVTIDYSVDGTNWAALGTYEFADAPGADGYAHNTEINFKSVSAKSVRLTITSSWMSAAQTGLSKVRFFYLPVWAREPKPATGSTNVSPITTTLTWRPGREAVQHQVYLGSDPNTLTLAGTTATASFAPTTLGVGGKYYWRIDEANAAASPALWAGDVWNFTTPNFLMVDDMESYTDLTGQAIFNIWKDGYKTTTNGGLIGYDPPAACMEKTLKVSGTQSTAFRYGQNPAPISEASLSFATPKDWTVAKADTLRVWVRGRTDNLPAAATIPASTSSFVISAGGSDIYQATDQFRFVYRTLTGDGSITAKVDMQEPTNQYAKAGVMMRVGTDAGAQQVYMVTLPGTPNTTTTPTQVEWSYRTPTGDATARSSSTTPSPAAFWVRLTRKGDVFTGEYSVDGVTNWISTNLSGTPQTIAMGTTVNVGMIVCSHVAGTLGLATFSSVKLTGTVGAADWQKTDIGWTFDSTTVVNPADTFYVAVSDGSTSKTVVPTLPFAATSVGVWQAADVPFSQFTGVKMNNVTKITVGVGDASRSTNPGPGQIYIDDIGVGHASK